MNIYVNGRFLAQRRSGMQRWAEELLSALDRRMDEEWSLPPVTVLHPCGDVRRPAWSRIQLRPIGSRHGHLWEQLDLFASSRDGLLVSLLSSGPILHPNHVITFHDAAVFTRPELFSATYGALHRTLRPMLARRAAALVTVSRFSAGELSRVFDVRPHDFTIVPNASDHMARQIPSLPPSELTEGEGFALCVGNQTPNKNVETAIRAFVALDRPRLKLALVGAGQAEVFGRVRLTDHPGVVRLGYVDDAQLAGLYRKARFLCFPSRYEGFGIPALEAMTLGCPVIASDAASIPEVVSDAALLVHPDDVQGFTTAMRRVLDEPGLAHALQTRGSARAHYYSWDASAAIFAGLLERIVGSKTRRLA